MLFIEPFFLFLVLPLSILTFYFSRRLGSTLALTTIVASSAIFYAPYGVTDFIILTLSLLINLGIGIILSRGNNNFDKFRKIFLILGLVFNFLILVFFKYVNPFTNTTDKTFNLVIGMAIPAGISFYTFHQSVFILDSYNKRPEISEFLHTDKSIYSKFKIIVRYFSFVAFFPQLVIGPITYMREFAPQILAKTFGQFKIVNLQVGLTLVAIGLFKKLCLADPLSKPIDDIYFAASAALYIPPGKAAFAFFGYYLQLYFDFSGYSDIAVGIGRLFGIRLPINFDSPLRATGIIDYYRRWHMTLTRVIALFLFTPISLWGARKAMELDYRGWRRRALSSWLPFLINFQVIALWHAAKSTFVVFGLVHGIWYVIETEVRSKKAFKNFRNRTSSRFRTLAGMAITVVPLMLTFALFRSPNLSTFWTLVKDSVYFGPVGPKMLQMSSFPRNLFILSIIIVYFLPNSYELLRRYRPGIQTFLNPSNTPRPLRFFWRPNLFWGLMVAGLGVFIFLRLNRPAPFIYAGF